MPRTPALLLSLLVTFALAAPPVAAVDAGATPRAEALALDADRAAVAAAERAEQVRESAAAVREVLDIGLSGDEVGAMLREARRRAPEPAAVARRVAAREREVAEARLDRVRLLEQSRLATDPAERERLAAELERQVAYLAAADAALAAERELSARTAALVSLLDGELLYVGSAPPIGPAWAREVADGARWAADPAAWERVGRELLSRLAANPVRSAAVTLLAGALVLARGRLVRRLGELAAPTGRYATDSFAYTLRAAVVTVLLAAPAPLALAWAGWLLSSATVGRGLSAAPDPFARAVAAGLAAAAWVWFVVDGFRQACRPAGLADAHFGWDARARRTLSRHLGWLLAVEVPAAVVVAAAEASGDEAIRQGVGRLAFLVGSAALTLFVAVVFRPSRGVFADLMPRDGWAWRLRRFWYGLLVAVPGGLTLAAAAGYYYTATAVQSRVFETGVVAFAAVLLYSLATRWLRVARRRVAYKQAREKLAELREARARRLAAGEEAADAAGSGEAVPELDEQKIDAEAAGAQTLVLVRTLIGAAALVGLWAVWSDLLSALVVLDRVQIVAPEIGPAGRAIGTGITLKSVLLGLFAAGLTWVAARNLPAVLSLLVLERFPIDAGARYAATTLARYAVVAVGLLVASDLVGIDWSRAQWVVAALGVGLGFGLQEIVANFVSGLIILFERPVRVGDTVTVGDVTGTVSRLQIRATTITDFENKEVLVPNKSFITDRVVNWSLTSPVTRLLVRVGVAYGTDVAAAREAIAGAVHAIPAVLAEPAPSVMFVGFGDSALNFEVRAFVGELSKRLPTTHELHAGIDAALRRAGIDIPFPQRSVHVRDLPPRLGEALGAVASNGDGESSDSVVPYSAGPGGDLSGGRKNLL